MRGGRAAAVVIVLVAACAPATDVRVPSGSPSTDAVHIVLGGDVMLGRGVASRWETDPAAPLAGVRATLMSADVAVANLESPLTDRPHLVGPDALEAAPAAASTLAAAGFDAMVIANNHAGDAGPGTVVDTAAALDAVGLEPVGLGPAVLLQRGGLTVAALAFDASGSEIDGLAAWDPPAARAAVRRARANADVVVVSLHGGAPYVTRTDRFLARAARRLARWGVDVVWGHGPHVVQPVRVIDPDGDGRVTVVATSLGNLLFDDQGIPGTDRGMLLELRAGRSGVVAYRLGTVALEEGRTRFVAWRPPVGDVVAFDDAWWTPVRAFAPAVDRRARPERVETRYPSWTIDRAVRGDVDADGRRELVVIARVPFASVEIYDAYAHPRARFADAEGSVFRLAVFGPGLHERWVSSLVVRPIGDIAACGGGLAVAYRTLGGGAVTGTGLWAWNGFGFAAPSNLTGTGSPGCADVDGDGRPEPVITGRGVT